MALTYNANTASATVSNFGLNLFRDGMLLRLPNNSLGFGMCRGSSTLNTFVRNPTRLICSKRFWFSFFGFCGRWLVLCLQGEGILFRLFLGWGLVSLVFRIFLRYLGIGAMSSTRFRRRLGSFPLRLGECRWLSCRLVRHQVRGL